MKPKIKKLRVPFSLSYRNCLIVENDKDLKSDLVLKMLQKNVIFKGWQYNDSSTVFCIIDDEDLELVEEIINTAKTQANTQ